jgi:AraC-like DNA-binding protein
LPSSSVRTFTDPAELGAAIRAAKIEVTTTGRGVFSGKIIRIDLHRLWMQRIFDNLPRVARAAASPARAIISFPSTPGTPHLWGGRELPWGAVYLVGNGQDIFQRSSGPAETASMSLPVDDLVSVVSAITHRDTKVQADGLIVRPPASAFVKLQHIHAAAGALAEDAHAVLANAEAARSLEQELVLAMVACMADVAEDDSLALRHHQGIMRRFRALIEANVGNPLYLPEMCAALGVSNRTLQRCCHEQLGLSPLRYLWLRRMHMVRGALVASPPTLGAVTEIATRYGFWELGHFSVAYRSLFGERPSATLHRPPDTMLKR